MRDIIKHIHVVKEMKRARECEHRDDPAWKCIIPGTPLYGMRVESIVADADIELGQTDRWRDYWQEYWAQIQCRIPPTRKETE